MSKDYVPRRDSHLRGWLEAIRKGMTDNGPNWLSPAEIAQAQQYCDEYDAQIRKVYEMKATMKGEVGKKKKMRTTHLKPLRKLISKAKLQPNFNRKTSELHATIWTQQETVETGTYKPHLKVKYASGFLEVRFKKKGINGMQIKVRVSEAANAGEWEVLPIRQFSPLKFKPTGYPVGTLLHVSFIGRAVVKDELIGEPSNVVSTIYEVELQPNA